MARKRKEIGQAGKILLTQPGLEEARRPSEKTDETSQDEGLEPDLSVFRPDREGVRKVLGDLEADIMEFIWKQVSPGDPGITVREVHEAFWLSHYNAYTTVMTTMARLARKRLLYVQKKKGTFFYSPRLTRDEFISNFVSRILENLLVSFSNVTESGLDQLSKLGNVQRVEALRAKVNELRPSKSKDRVHQTEKPAQNFPRQNLTGSSES